MKKMIGVLSLLGLMLTGCGSDKEEQTNKGQDSNGPAISKSLEDGVLTVGMECDYAPYNWTTTKEKASEEGVEITGSVGYAEGYDVMMARRLAKKLGVELEVRKITWDGLIPALKSGQIDAIIAGMSPTDTRRKAIDFSESYFTNEINLHILVNKDSGFGDGKTLNDFKGAKISTQLGTFHGDLLPQIEGVEGVKAFDSYSSLMQAAIAGTIDGYIAEESVAREQSEASKGRLVDVNLEDGGSGFTLTPDQNTSAIGLRKGDDLLREGINSALSEVSNDERMKLMANAEEMAGN